MDQGHLAQTLARIEDAFVRIDEAIARPRPETPAAAVVEQNMRLRQAIGDALAQLDDLIGDIEG